MLVVAINLPVARRAVKMSNFIVGDLPAAKRVNQLSFSDILLPFPPFYTIYSSYMHCDWLKIPVCL